MFNYDETYDKVFEKLLGPNMLFPDFIDPEEIVKKTKKITDYLYERSQRLDVECNYCEKVARKEFTREVYETPWDEEPVEKHFCSEECEEYYLHSGDFQYFICDECGREVCEQNPRNGWMIQYRYYDDTMFCLKCFEEEMLKNGLSLEALESGKMTGMFFNHKDLEDAGYEECKSFFIDSQTGEDICKKYCLRFKKSGHDVVINYERIAIGGIEGTLTVWCKRSSLQS